MFVKDHKGNKRFFTANLCCKKMRFTALILFFLFIFSSTWCSPDSSFTIHETPVIATVNEFPITVKEFEAYLEESRTEVVSHFIREFNLNGISPGFWDHEFEDQKPADLLKEIALQKAIKTKIRLVYMYEKKVIESPDYAYFLKIYNDFCEERRESPDGNIKYGPVQMSERDFFNYWYSNALIELKNRIHYEDTPSIPLAPSARMKSGYYSSSSDFKVGKSDRKNEIEIERIFNRRIQLYESNSVVKTDNQLFKNINFSF